MMMHVYKKKMTWQKKKKKKDVVIHTLNKPFHINDITY